MATDRQQASVELSVILHGDAAILQPSPPGPDTCPDTCSWCYHQVTVLQPRSEPEPEVAEGAG